MDQSGPTTAPYALAVDDNHMILMHLAELLEDAGFLTLTAFCAEEAVLILEKHGSAIVPLFTNVEMPGQMDGFASAQMAAERWPSIDILVAPGACHPKKETCQSAEVIHDRQQQLLPDAQKPPLLVQKPR